MVRAGPNEFFAVGFQMGLMLLPPPFATRESISIAAFFPLIDCKSKHSTLAHYFNYSLALELKINAQHS